MLTVFYILSQVNILSQVDAHRHRMTAGLNRTIPLHNNVAPVIEAWYPVKLLVHITL